MDLSFEELKKRETGAILHDILDEGLRFIVMRGPTSLCAYIGIPIEHPLSGFSYNDLPLDCHGGLTFSSKGKGKWPEGFWWYGWDYSHCDDYSFYYDDLTSMKLSKDKKWLVKDVIEDCWNAIYEFKKLMKLAEKISNKKITNPPKQIGGVMDKSGSAFPRESFEVINNVGEYTSHIIPAQNGLTKREWFAGMALQGILFADWKDRASEQDLGKWAFEIADNMIKESKKEL